ncbi:ribonuclease E inhibitor RraB [Arenimonas malthae]|uniref:ribonuclease E inhibitor RraB n=1 Tax=Arenimonas malthae TaxID=354197 RepID=UPI0014700BE6|nr:ribonuclease E inhibitor RraB [Arenimonas malthae]
MIEHLKDAGSDLSKPHNIDFFFYFPDQASANAAAIDLRTLGYRIVGIAPTSDESAWHLKALRSMVPELAAMNQSTRELNALAARHGGEYDGWGTSVVD